MAINDHGPISLDINEGASMPLVHERSPTTSRVQVSYIFGTGIKTWRQGSSSPRSRDSPSSRIIFLGLGATSNLCSAEYAFQRMTTPTRPR